MGEGELVVDTRNSTNLYLRLDHNHYLEYYRMKKIRVAVLYGGRSGEHEVSLVSAFSVVKNLDKTRFEIVPIGIDKKGHWWLNDFNQLPLNGNVKSLPLRTDSSSTFSVSRELMSQKVQENGCSENTVTDAQANHECAVDVVFPVMHGPLCEDGTMQGLLETFNIPYVGAAVLASAMAMDKDITKRLAGASHIPVVPYFAVKQTAWKHDPVFFEKLIIEKFQYPVFVKPANLGSSVGIHKVKCREDLSAAVNDAFLYDSKIIIEKAINAREIELAVLENSHYGEAALVSVAGEIIPSLEFYSYDAKYKDGQGTKLVVPADLNADQLKQAQDIARRVFEIMECESMARVDLFLDKDTGEFYFNEVNTLPGFTEVSMYPKLWEASGIKYPDLLSHLIDLALARHERKSALKRESN
jgi:D-alanine-D-alanine ligase